MQKLKEYVKKEIDKLKRGVWTSDITAIYDDGEVQVQVLITKDTDEFMSGVDKELFEDDLPHKVKVKPLVWDANNCAYTSLGAVFIEKAPYKSPDRYDVEFLLGDSLYGFPDLESAKKAAQKRYEELVLEDIEC